MKRNLSIRLLTGKYLTMVLLVSLSGLLLLAWAGWRMVDEDSERHQQFEMRVLQRQFSEVLGFYQGIAAQLSSNNEVTDILEYGDKERAITWAREVRSLLPESIGVALIDAEGETLGEPVQLNLGGQCVNDLNALFSGEHVPSPPVHRADPRNAHFDVLHEVKADGEVLGVLFISFSLDVIQHRVNRLADADQVLMVVDSEGRPIAAKGGNPEHENRWEGKHGIAIEGTDWQLFYLKERRGASTYVVFTLGIAAVLIVATIGAMLVLSLRLVALFRSDLGFIKEQLSRVDSGEQAAQLHDKTLLAETSSIMRDVAELTENIRQANARLKELSLNDELSGLLNRRGFDEQLAQEWELSARGVNASLVFLDIDHFKLVNDRFGHLVGDAVIRAFAQSLRERCRKTDIVARLGGDEFAVILNSHGEAESIVQWYRQLGELFEQMVGAITEVSAPIRCTLSAGAVRLNKGRYSTLQQQMAEVDRALYRAKEEGRARIFCDFP